jgi:hypothetical protein
MNAKKAAGFVIAFVLCIAVVGILRSCVLLRTAASQAKLRLLLASLPEPENAVLLDEASGVGGGSDDRCYTAYVHRLYGSDQVAEDILGFFRDILLSGDEWKETNQRSDSGKLTFYDRQDGFRLTIDYNVASYAMPGFTQFSESSIAEARQQFAMPFVVVVNHADRATRESCWPEWER